MSVADLCRKHSVSDAKFYIYGWLSLCQRFEVFIKHDLDVAESVLRRWMQELIAAPAAAFPGNGKMRAGSGRDRSSEKRGRTFVQSVTCLKESGSFFVREAT